MIVYIQCALLVRSIVASIQGQYLYGISSLSIFVAEFEKNELGAEYETNLFVNTASFSIFFVLVN